MMKNHVCFSEWSEMNMKKTEMKWYKYVLWLTKWQWIIQMNRKLTWMC